MGGAVRSALKELFVLKRQVAGLRRRVLGGGGSGTSDTTTQVFAITEVGHYDYFIAREIINVRLNPTDGGPIGDLGTVDFKIAKARIVRRSISRELLFGSVITYRDDDVTDVDNTRIANDGSKDERQVCLPPYITVSVSGLTDQIPMDAQCVVYAQKLTDIAGVFDDDGKQLEWMETTSGVRTFAKRFITP